jgi:hypothetical protein
VHTHEYEERTNWMKKTGVMAELFQYSEDLCRQQKAMSSQVFTPRADPNTHKGTLHRLTFLKNH